MNVADSVWHKTAEVPVHVEAEKDDFIRAVEVWIHKPHTLNRRLCGVKVLSDTVHQCDKREELAVQLYEQLCHHQETCDLENIVPSATKTNLVSEATLKCHVRNLLPKRLDKYRTTGEIILLDDQIGWVAFIPSFQDEDATNYVTPPYMYALKWDDSGKSIQLWVYFEQDLVSTLAEQAGVLWLTSHLMPRLKKWAEVKPTGSSDGGSLRLVPVDRYNELYQHLKQKYGPHLVQNWPEKTDPSKFVYEDIAIATYLLLLWEQQRNVKELDTKQSFVDLGCGNGLLVYILTKEGHHGIGLDVRKRGVWDMFGNDIQLQVASVIPTPETTFEFDWLIGNHSDELTPWIPVMASRSSYGTCFFVLPCCAHDFDRKFQRTTSGISQYRSYLDYVRQVSEVCGFVTEEDKLRIPSTKRVCFVGSRRSYQEDDEALVDKERINFISSRCQYASGGSQTSLPHLQSAHSGDHKTPEEETVAAWETNFQARCAVEPVRNCTRLDKDLVIKILTLVVTALLASEEERIEVAEPNTEPKKWNAGRRMRLPDLVKLVEKDDLLQLKKECGGFQTLLKNHSHIFEVYEGTVGFRNYSHPPNARTTKKTTTKKRLITQRQCWFNANHPDGCPVPESLCKYTHNE